VYASKHVVDPLSMFLQSGRRKEREEREDNCKTKNQSFVVSIAGLARTMGGDHDCISAGIIVTATSLELHSGFMCTNQVNILHPPIAPRYPSSTTHSNISCVLLTLHSFQRTVMP